MSELLDAVEDGVALFDANTALVLCNARYRELNPLIANLLVPGMAWEMLLRQAVQRSVISEDEANRLRLMETRLAEGAQAVPTLDLQTASGSLHEVSLRQTSVGGFIVLQRDATAARQYAQSDQQADVLLRKVLEACPANIVMSRIGDGQILYRSPAATELLGTSRCYYDHFASREERADFITALLPDGSVDDIQVTGLRADGSSFPCTISARVIEYRDEDVMVSNTVDISKELALQRTLADQRERIFQAEKMSALGELLAGVAHELNNPLSVVVGHALMMRDEATDPNILRRIRKISDSAERCARIVKSFLAMARQQPVRLAPVDLHEALETAIDALENGATGLTSKIVVDLPSTLPRILADADQMSQIFINLISNADQAIKDSGIGELVRVSARYDAGSKMVDVRVSDEGPGIPLEIRSRIFDPLFTTKEVGKGTGIGLAFCHRIVSSHGGQIYLEPDSGQGTTFVVRLPATHSPEERSDQSLPHAQHVTADRVLVIEDEQDVADLIREVLQREGLHVDHVDSAEAALSTLKQRGYSLILTDLNMPGLGGRGFYNYVARDYPELVAKIGFVTGDTMSPSARIFLDSAKRPYLEKPLGPAELLRLARNLLAEAKLSVSP
jgi:C4-dicarboxylate-specific signal transduction histidine kinase